MASGAAWDWGARIGANALEEGRARKNFLSDQDHAIKRDEYLKDTDLLKTQLNSYVDDKGQVKPEYKDQYNKAMQALAQNQYQLHQLYDPIKAPGRLQADWHYLRERVHGIKQPQTPAAPRVTQAGQDGSASTTMPGMQGDPTSIPATGNTPEVLLGNAPAPITSPELPAYKQASVTPAAPLAKPVSWRDAELRKRQALAMQKAQQEAGLLAAGAGLSPEQQATIDSSVSLAKIRGAVNNFKAINPDATKEEISAYANSLMPGYASKGNWKIVGATADGQPVSYDIASGRYRMHDGTLSMSPPEGFVSASKSENSRPVPYYAGAVNLDTAKSLQKQGKVYNGEDGKPYDLDSLPEGSILMPVFLGGGKSYYQIATDKGRYETGDNLRKFEPAVGGPNPNAPNVGQARVPTTRSSTTPGPNGPVTTTSVTSPVTGGNASRPIAPRSSSGLPTVSPRGNTSNPKPKVAPSTQENNTSKIPPMRDPKLPPMKGADERAIASIAAPVATIEQQVVGQGNKPLWEYSAIFNNPELRKAVNLAMVAPMLQTPEGSKNPGFWETITRSLGLVSAAQQVTTEQIVAARDKVQEEGGPQALEFLDRLAELKGTIPNLRKVQGGSSAMAAMQPLIQESPIMNISSPEDFRNRTANMLRTLAVALDNTPGINKAHVNWLYGQANQAQNKKPDALKQVGAIMNAVSGSNSTIPDNTAGTWDNNGHTYYVDKDGNVLGEVKK